MFKANHLLLKSVIILSAAGVLTACDDDNGDSVISSTNVPTNRVYATIDIYSDGKNNINSSVQLTKDTEPTEDRAGDEYIRLDGDQLWISTGESIEDVKIGDDFFAELKALSDSQELYEGDTRGYTIYPFFFFWSALIPTQIFYNGHLKDVDDGTTFRVSLFRDNFSDAKNSFVTMPDKFELEAPLSSDSFSRENDSISVTWSPRDTDTRVELSFDTNCGAGDSENYTTTITMDDGVFVIPPGTLSDMSLSGDCNTVLTVAKRKLGTLDSNFIGGVISANQVRSVSFKTTD